MLLGMRIRIDITGAILLDKEYYISETLERFNMKDCNTVDTPHGIGVHLTSEMCPITDAKMGQMSHTPYKELIGSLNYIATMTRLDIYLYSHRSIALFCIQPEGTALECGVASI
jgi:hypothetical protein